MFLAFVITLSYFTLFFIVATILKNNSIVDIGWGLGFVLVSWILFFISGTYNLSAIVVNVMVSLWGFRLFYYILKRNIFEKEDFRYAAWRKSWGKWVIPRAFLQVFLLQGLLQFMIGSTAYFINTNNIEFNYVSLIGVGIWMIGYFFQVVGDQQLKNHIKNKENKGTLLTTGLWKYTRHPNYFGESVMWWGILVYALLLGANWFYIISPITITLVLYFISTPLLEKNMRKYDGWDQYASITPMFVPIKLK